MYAETKKQMRLKNYGLPYKGSKNTIAEDIVAVLPAKKILVDLFGGGGAITDYALQCGKYEKVIYNEIDTTIAETFKKALNGECEDKDRWISRDEFEKIKNVDGYYAVLYSFGNDCYRYIYSRDKEPIKMAYHHAVVLDDFKPLKKFLGEDIIQRLKNAVEGIKDTKKRRLVFTKEYGRYLLSLEDTEYNRWLLTTVNTRKKSIRHLLEHEERGERIRGLKCNSVKNITIYALDYASVELPNPNDCVIYCDIPYEGTHKYKTAKRFDYDRFYRWVEEKAKEGYEIYVSSYDLPTELFTEVWSKTKYTKYGMRNGKHKIEKLYIPT